MMKILILANNVAGLLSFRQEVISALLEKGYEVVVSVPYDERIEEIKALGCKVLPTEIHRRSTNPIHDIKLLSFYLNLLSEEHPNVVLTYTIKPNIFGGLACRLKKIPYIVNITGLGSAVENHGLLQKLTVLLYRAAMKNASCIFFQNKGNQQFFASRHINNSVHHLIPGSGANLNKFTLQPYPNSSKTKFLYISRIMKEKGIEEYLEAAIRFKALRDDLEFHIVGACEEDYLDQLNTLHRDGVVIYHGIQKDVRPIISQSNCLIHPSFYPEGMSNVILEACSVGRPVITTRRHGCMEAVENGVTGFLIPQQDKEALIAAINKFLSLSHSECMEMGKKARDKIEREFDRQIVIDAYLDEISKI